jgi:hypothetical protein
MKEEGRMKNEGKKPFVAGCPRLSAILHSPFCILHFL